MSYLEVFGVQTGVGVDVSKFLGFGAGARVLKHRAGAESEKGDSAHLWYGHRAEMWRPGYGATCKEMVNGKWWP